MHSDSARSDRLPLQGLRETRRIIRERWVLLTLAIVVCMVVATLSESRRPEIYTAYAKVALSPSSTPEAAFFGQRPTRAEGTPTTRAARAARLAMSDVVGRSAGRRLTGRRDVSVAGLITASPAPSGVVNVGAVSEAPRVAAAVANAAAKALVSRLINDDKALVREAIAEYRRELRDVSPPKTRADLVLKLSLERSLVRLRVFLREPGSARLLAAASVPTRPEEEANARTAPAVMFGGSVAMLLLVLLDRVSRRARGATRLSDAAGVALLAALPGGGRRHELRRRAAYDLLRATLTTTLRDRSSLSVAIVPLGRRPTANDVAAGLADALERSGRAVVVGADASVAAPPGAVAVVPAPSAEHAADALELAARADIVILSAHAGDALVDEVAGADAALRALGVEPLGLVVVGAPAAEAPAPVAERPPRRSSRSLWRSA